MKTEEEVEKVESMEDTMNAILDDIDTREEEVVEKRARDEDGKFAKAEKEEVAEAKPDTKPAKKKAEKTESVEVHAESTVIQPVETNTEVKPATDIRAPSSWGAEGKAKFATLDPAIQKEVLKREEDFHRGIEQYKTKAGFADNIYREIAPYEAMLRSEGASPEAAVRHLFSAAYTLRTGTPQQKMQLISSVAQMYGVEMPQGGEESNIDPTVYALQQQVQQLQTTLQQGQQQQETATTQTLSNEIEQFKADPQNIYFENVKQDMAALLQAGRATNLKEAYDMATWARPDVREQMLAKQSRTAEEKRIAEATQAAVAAKKSAPVNVKSKGVFQPSNAGKTMFDTMGSVYDDIQQR